MRRWFLRGGVSVPKTFRTIGTVLAFLWVAALYSSRTSGWGVTEAPTGFDNLTNGFVDQPTFDAAKAVFEEHEAISDGLGPVYNADSCASCHANPVTGAISQITELRAGHFDGVNFIDQVGGSLINDRAIDPSIQERVFGSSEVRTFRTSLNTIGDGFVESIADSTLLAIRDNQPSQFRGTAISVPVGEAGGLLAIGRFGWKNQHASLVSFSADAYLNEMGITSPLQPTENTSNGRSVAAFDTVPDPDNDGVDVELFALFMRSTKAPSVDADRTATPDAQAGSTLFNQIGCNVCHNSTIVTEPPGTVINGGALVVANAVGSKRIHPFGDYLLHDIGTGDGIVQNGGASTRNKVRTAPLWGLRARGRFMHDALSQNIEDAIG